MASIRKEFLIDASAGEVWDAIADFGALHTRLVPGFVTDTKLDGDVRIVQFANGAVAREIHIDCDHARMRLAYAIMSERLAHHCASVQVAPDGARRCRTVWITDVLPHDIAPHMDGQMELGARAMQAAFRRTAL